MKQMQVTRQSYWNIGFDRLSTFFERNSLHRVALIETKHVFWEKLSSSSSYVDRGGRGWPAPFIHDDEQTLIPTLHVARTGRRLFSPFRTHHRRVVNWWGRPWKPFCERLGVVTVPGLHHSSDLTNTQTSVLVFGPRNRSRWVKKVDSAFSL